jgi:hypothetical protein
MSKYKLLSSLLGRRVDLLSNSINYTVGHKMLAKNCYFLHKHFSSDRPWHHSEYMNLKYLVYQCILKRSVYLAIQQIVPCLPTQDVTNCKLDRIKREVENKAVQPNDSRPSPPNALDLGKSPICIYCEECCYLWSYPQGHSSDNSMLLSEKGMLRSHRQVEQKSPPSPDRENSEGQEVEENDPPVGQ